MHVDPFSARIFLPHLVLSQCLVLLVSILIYSLVRYELHSWWCRGGCTYFQFFRCVVCSFLQLWCSLCFTYANAYCSFFSWPVICLNLHVLYQSQVSVLLKSMYVSHSLLFKVASFSYVYARPHCGFYILLLLCFYWETYECCLNHALLFVLL